MEHLVKLLSNGVALSGWAVAVVGIAAVGLGWLRLIREYQDVQDRSLEQKDEELAKFRQANEALTVEVKQLRETAARLENRTVHQGAVLYGKQEYIRRLERVIKQAKLELPPRNGEPP